MPEYYALTHDDQLPGELDIDIDAARAAVGCIVKIDTGALAVVVGCRIAACDGDDVWTVRDEFGSWHDVLAGASGILGRVDDTGHIDWEV